MGAISEKTGQPVSIRQTGLGEPVEYSARDCFTKSSEIFAAAELEGERARTLREWARFELRHGNKEEGIKLWQEARGLFEKLGANLEVERMAELPSS
jgi:hypothetical protein